MTDVAELDDAVSDHLARPRRADPPREIDQCVARGASGPALDSTQPVGRRCCLRDGALADVVGVAGKARRHVLAGLRRVHDDGNPTGDPASQLRLRAVLRREAKAIHAVFVDPLAGGWLAGASQRLISGDGIHATDAGHRHIARLVLGSLRR